jgi:hypothetical protein
LSSECLEPALGHLDIDYLGKLVVKLDLQAQQIERREFEMLMGPTPYDFISPERKSSTDIKSIYRIEKYSIFIEYELEIANWLLASEGGNVL